MTGRSETKNGRRKIKAVRKKRGEVVNKSRHNFDTLDQTFHIERDKTITNDFDKSSIPLANNGGDGRTYEGTSDESDDCYCVESGHCYWVRIEF